MNSLKEIILNDMKPALGVTEPGAIALASAMARTLTTGEIESLVVRMNSGIYKGAFTCSIPGTDRVGSLFAAALGCVSGNAKKGLLVLENITKMDIEKADGLISSGKVRIELADISSDLYIQSVVKTNQDEGEAVISGASHDNFTLLRKNNEQLLNIIPSSGEEKTAPDILAYSLKDLYEYARSAPVQDLAFMASAWKMNLELALSSFESDICIITKELLRQNGNVIYSNDFQKTAVLLTCAAVEARVLGLNRPAMSITGSGNHGIISVMPLYALYKTEGCSEEQLLRGIAFSYLVTIYMKAHSGKIAPYCGCAIAAGSGACCGIAIMKGATPIQISGLLTTLSSSIVGMICHGGNQGCVIKVLSALESGFHAVNLAMQNVYVDSMHGIAGISPEQTMQNIGRIATPGMTATEATIIDIIQHHKC